MRQLQRSYYSARLYGCQCILGISRILWYSKHGQQVVARALWCSSPTGFLYPDVIVQKGSLYICGLVPEYMAEWWTHWKTHHCATKSIFCIATVDSFSNSHDSSVNFNTAPASPKLIACRKILGLCTALSGWQWDMPKPKFPWYYYILRYNCSAKCKNNTEISVLVDVMVSG